jgi:YVTN family beta-propeller protein
MAGSGLAGSWVLTRDYTRNPMGQNSGESLDLSPTATLSTNPAFGNLGSSAVASGSGYSANSRVILSLGGVRTNQTSCETNASGSFSDCGFAVPNGPTGNTALTASDNSGVSIAATVNLGVNDQPNGLGYAFGSGKVFVADLNMHQVTVINDTTDKVVHNVSVGSRPHAVVYDPFNGLVYVSNYDYGSLSNLSVFYASNYTALPSIPVGDGPDGLAVDSVQNEILVANFNSNTVSVIAGDNDTVVTTVPVGTHPICVAYDFDKGVSFVTNSGSNNVTEINDSSDRVIRNIPVGSAPWGVDYSPLEGNIYVSNQGAGTVSVISDRNNTVFKTVSVGSQPDSVAYDGGNGQFYVADSGSGNVTVISESSVTVVATLNVGSGPLGVTYDWATGGVFVSNEISNTVSVLRDGAFGRASFSVASISVSGANLLPTGVVTVNGTGFNSNAPISLSLGDQSVLSSNCSSNSVGNFQDCQVRIPDDASGNLPIWASASQSIRESGSVQLSSGSSPMEMGYAFSANKVFVADLGTDQVSVINATSLGVFGNVSVGSRPHSVTYDTSKNLIYVSNFNYGNAGNVSAFNASTLRVTASIPVQDGPYGLTYDERLGRVYVANFDSNSVSVISDRNQTVIASIPVGSNPVSVALDPSSGTVWVTDYDSNSVTVISDASDAVVQNISVGSHPWGIDYDSALRAMFISNQGSNTVSIVSDTNYSVFGTVSVGSEPDALAYDPASGLVLVANSGNGTVSAIADSSLSVEYTCSVGSGPLGVAYDWGSDTTFVSDEQSDQVSVLTVGRHATSLLAVESLPPPSLRPNVTVLTNTTMSLLLYNNTSLRYPDQSLPGSVFLFSSEATQLEDISMGSIIASSHQGGFIVQVSSIAITSSGKCFKGVESSGYCVYGNATTLESAATPMDGSWFGSSSSISIGDVSGNFGGGAPINVSLVGSLVPSLFATVMTSDAGLLAAYFGIGFHLSGNFNITVGGNVSTTAQVDIPILKFPSFGELPTLITPVLSAGFGVDLNTTGPYSLSTDVNWNESVGLVWDYGQWVPTLESTNSTTIVQQSITGTASVRVYLIAFEITFVVDGIAGPYFDFEPGLLFETSTDGWNLSYDSTFDVGVQTNPYLDIGADWGLDFPVTTTVLQSDQYAQSVLGAYGPTGESAKPLVGKNSYVNLWLSGFPASGGAKLYSNSIPNSNGSSLLGTYTVGSNGSYGPINASLSEGSNYFAAYDSTYHVWTTWLSVFRYNGYEGGINASFTKTNPSDNSLRGGPAPNFIYFWATGFSAGDKVQLLAHQQENLNGTCFNYVGKGCEGGASIWDHWLINSSSGSVPVRDSVPGGTWDFTFYDVNSHELSGNWISITLVSPEIEYSLNSTPTNPGSGTSYLTMDRFESLHIWALNFSRNESVDLLVVTDPLGALWHTLGLNGNCENISGKGCIDSASILASWTTNASGDSSQQNISMPGTSSFSPWALVAYDVYTGALSNWIMVAVHQPSISGAAIYVNNGHWAQGYSTSEVQLDGSTMELRLAGSLLPVSTSIELLENSQPGTGGHCTDVKSKGCLDGASIWANLTTSGQGNVGEYNITSFADGTYYFAFGLSADGVISNWLEVVVEFSGGTLFG